MPNRLSASARKKIKRNGKTLGKTLDITPQKWYNEYENRGRKTPQTRKGIKMKKSSMKSLVSFFDTTVTVDVPQHIKDICDEMRAELAKGEAKAQANRDMYAEAKDVILGALSDTPATISEIYAEVADALPEGFTKSKVQYAITRLWADEVVKTEGKVNGYSRKG